MYFEGKTVIVTGSGGGIGEGYAKACAQHGMNVVVAEINEQAGQHVVANIQAEGGKALFVKTDVSDESSAQHCADEAVKTFGGIDYLINNAAIFGGMKSESYLTIDMDYLERFMKINMHGCLIMARAVVPHMEARGAGVIINQSSTAAWIAAGYYGVAKLAVNGITQSLARELGPKNIRVNAIAPGPTDTEALRQQASAHVEHIIATMPLRRLGTPANMADAVLFLLSEQADFITGQILNVDGGHVMRP